MLAERVINPPGGIRTFGHLRGRKNGPNGRPVDWLVRRRRFRSFAFRSFLCVVQRPLPLNEPQLLRFSDDEEVTITLIDANHCPGAVMCAAAFPHFP